MKQLIVDYLPFEIKPEHITESIKENDGKLIVRGVLILKVESVESLLRIT